MTTTPAVGRRVDRAVVAAGVLLALFAVLTGLVAARVWPVGADAEASRTLTAWATRHLAVVDMSKVLTWAGHPLVVDAIVLVTAALLWRRGRAALAVALVASGVASLVVRWAVKVAVDRPRPDSDFSRATGASFPSGHTAGAAFVGVAFAVLWRRAWVAVVATAYVVVVGLTRLVLEVHWPSDVVAGVLLGAAFAVVVPPLAAVVDRRWPRRSGPPPVS